MKRYLIIKIGGSNQMVDLITQVLNPFVSAETDEVPGSANFGTVLMFSFLSNSKIDEIIVALQSYHVTNCTVTEINHNNFRNNLHEKANETLKFKPICCHSLSARLHKAEAAEKIVFLDNDDNRSIQELELALEKAVNNEMYELACIVRDKIKSKTK